MSNNNKNVEIKLFASLETKGPYNFGNWEIRYDGGALFHHLADYLKGKGLINNANNEEKFHSNFHDFLDFVLLKELTTYSALFRITTSTYCEIKVFD